MLLTVRVAAGLVLLLGQPISRVASMRHDQILIAADDIRVRITNDPIDVPKPFATLLAQLAEHRANLQTAAHIDSPWLFPGHSPGQHITPNSIATQLRKNGAPPLRGRQAALQALARTVPAKVLSDALGVSVTTAMHHAEAAGANYARYPRTRVPR